MAPVPSGEGLQTAQCPVKGPEQDQGADGQAGADSDRESFRGFLHPDLQRRHRTGAR